MLYTRKGVYEALDSERAYQKVKWPDPLHEAHSFEEWIVYIETYLNDAKTRLSKGATSGTEDTINDIFRKVTAMGVAALEHHGVQRREEY